jgi:hypothetical protein
MDQRGRLQLRRHPWSGTAKGNFFLEAMAPASEPENVFARTSPEKLMGCCYGAVEISPPQQLNRLWKGQGRTTVEMVMSQIQIRWSKNLIHDESDSDEKSHLHPHSRVKFQT